MTARVVVLASGKGGVGKSTLALALADVWAGDEGGTRRRVALVDFDPQGGVTRAAGVPTPADPATAAPVPVHGFQLFPAGRALVDAPAGALTRRLETARAAADVVVVDLSPTLTDAPHAVALAAAGVVLVVARCDAAGLPNVAETVQLATAAGRPVRVVPTFRTHTGLAREAEAFLRGRYGERVTAAVIPSDARAAEAAGVGRPVTQTARRSRMAEAVRQLVNELNGTGAA